MLNILKYKILSALAQEGIMGIVRDKNEEDALTRARALIAGGIRLLEISLATPGALGLIALLAKEATQSEENIYIGAGTVLDAESAYSSINQGATFIISPNFNVPLVQTCNRHGIPCMPGVQTVTEIVTAMENGVDVVKIFPGSTLGPEFIKAVHGPLPHANCMPVGGVTIDNIGSWFKAGAFAVALGTGLTHPSGKDCDFDTIKVHAQHVIQKLRAERFRTNI